MDDDGNESDSDDATLGDQAADGSVGVDRAEVAVTAGLGGPINKDGVLTPSTLSDWVGTASTHSGTLRLIVKLLKKQDGDVLSLETGYDASKITALNWDDGTAELRLDFQSGTTAAEIGTALGKLWLDTSDSRFASERRVWVYPILQGVSNVRYRFDESAGLVRHYFYDTTNRFFADATTAASGRSLLGKNGYLGVFTSEAEKTIYKALWQASMHVAITDVATENEWVITAGPRKGKVLFRDEGSRSFGPGADGSGWSTPTDFWYGSEPDDWKGRNNSKPDGENYATIHKSDRLVQDVFDGERDSISHHDLWLSEGEIVARSVDVGKSPPNPVLEAHLSRTRVDSGKRLVLTQNHILVKDIDTRDPMDDTKVDASKITLRVSGVSGGTLQLLDSTSGNWDDMALATGETYYAFTLADLKAGKVAFLAGDGLASGEGEKITFQIQAADDGPNLSDSDPNDGENDADPVDGEISIFVSTKLTAGTGGLINEDGALTPDDTALTDWIGTASTHSGTLRLIVKLQDKKEGDALSLRGIYETSKIVASDWNDGTAELWLDVQNGTTEAEIRTALGTLWLDTSLFRSARERRVWVYPILRGVSNLRYRFDEAAGLVRHYYYDSSYRSFSDASTQAEGRTFFGKGGYLGVYTSDTEKSIYIGFDRDNIFLAISDATVEGKWVITAGPRKGQLFWDDTNNQFGTGAAGSGWTSKGDFWYGSEPNTASNDYAEVDSNGRVSDVGSSKRSVSHHDLWLSDGEIVAHSVDVGKSPPNPVLEVRLSRTRADSEKRLVLTENHILVSDADTLDGDNNLDASKIKLRVSGLQGGALELLDSTSGSWDSIDLSGSSPNQYQEFTLADLKAGNVAFLAGDGLQASGGEKITFKIQAADDGMPNDPSSSPHLSDSDPTTSGLDPVDVEISIVVLTKLTAGTGGYVNADGDLTPGPTALTDWMGSVTTHGGTLRLIVKLQDKKNGDVLSLKAGYDASKITASDWKDGTAELWLDVQNGTTAAEIETALGKLWLDTSLFRSVRERRVWVYPVLEGVSNLRYRLDEAAGLVRYYLYDSTSRSFSAASTEASGRSLFGKSGYLGAYTSDTEKSIYTGFNQNDIFLAISDEAAEGKWVITAGPRKGKLFWDHTEDPKVYGPGAVGSGWSAQGDFWTGSEPSGGNSENYAEVDSNGGVSDVGGGSGKSVTQFDLLLSEWEIVARSVDVGKSPPNPVLKVDFGNVQVSNDSRLVLTEDHILVDDADTLDVDNNLDASKIKLRVSGLEGGTLELLDSGSWGSIALSGTHPNQYQEFTLADLKAGKIAFLVGDGVAKVDGGKGVKITFQIQAADDGDGTQGSTPNLSANPLDVEIPIIVSAKVTAGAGGYVNEDGALTDDTALSDWVGTATTHSGTLRLIVKLLDKKDGDVLSLATGYDASKITVSDWDDDTNTDELWLDVQSGTTAAEIGTALGKLWLDTSDSRLASERRIWVYPILQGVSSLLRYRFDESAGLVRHYFYDTTNRTFSAASTAAEGRTLFGKSGYLGVHTSNAERDIYKALWKASMHLAITDVTTEGKWVITAGPRQGQVLWDHTVPEFGPGAEGSGWNTRGDFWNGSREPDNWKGRNNSNPDGEDYATIYASNRLVQDIFDGSRDSISHHDLWLSEGEIVARSVDVGKSPPNPRMEVHLSRTQVDSGKRLVLTQNHILVKDIDTVLNDDTVDASRITLRVSGVSGGTLHA